MLKALDRLVTSVGKTTIWLVITLLAGIRSYISRYLTGDWNMTLDAIILWGNTMIDDSAKFGTDPVFMMVGSLVLTGVFMDIFMDMLRILFKLRA